MLFTTFRACPGFSKFLSSCFTVACTVYQLYCQEVLCALCLVVWFGNWLLCVIQGPQTFFSLRPWSQNEDTLTGAFTSETATTINPTILTSMIAVMKSSTGLILCSPREHARHTRWCVSFYCSSFYVFFNL